MLTRAPDVGLEARWGHKTPSPAWLAKVKSVMLLSQVVKNNKQQGATRKQQHRKQVSLAGTALYAQSTAT